MIMDKQVVGFIGFGEINSPKELIDRKCSEAKNALLELGFPLVSSETVTDDPCGSDVKRAISDLKKQPFNVLVICLAGWIPSHTVIAVTSEFKHCPMILWGLCGDRQNGHIVTAAAQAGTTALRQVFAGLGYRFRYCWNIIGQPFPMDRIRSFILAAAAQKTLESCSVGMMGFRDMRLYNTLYDGISLKQKLGIEIDFFEMLEVAHLVDHDNTEEIESVLNYIRSSWEFVKPVEENFLKKGIVYYLAIKKIAAAKGFAAVSLKDVDGMKKIMQFPPAMIFMLLADIDGLCTIPENDAMGAVTQLVVRALTGQGGSYLEFYEFFENSVLMGVPDYVAADTVEGRVRVTNATFGGITGGLLNISTMKTGQVTLARLSSTGSAYTMHIARGQASICAWEEAGWDQPAPQLPSLSIQLESPVEQFAEQVSGQHYIIAYGDHVNALVDFCYLADINVICS